MDCFADWVRKHATLSRMFDMLSILGSSSSSLPLTRQQQTRGNGTGRRLNVPRACQASPEEFDLAAGPVAHPVYESGEKLGHVLLGSFVN